MIRFGKDSGKATAQSIARWLVLVIERAQGRTAIEAGKNAISGHSVRAAATSCAFEKGISIDNIIKAADWANDSTFGRFYLHAHKDFG